MIKIFKHNTFKLLANTIIILLISGITGFSLLIIAYLIPTSRIRININNAIEQYTDYPHTFLEWASGYTYTTLDDYTDATFILTNSAYEGNESVVEKALLIPHVDYYGVDNDIIYELDDSYQGDSFIWYYARYWHGYLIFMKPLLYLMSLSGVRLLNFFFQLISTLLFMYMLALKTHDLRLGVSFTLSFLILNPVSTAMNFQLAAVYNVTIIALFIILFAADKLNDNFQTPLIFVFIGIATVYFDFLTYPLVSLLLPLFLYLALKRDLLTENKQSMSLLALKYAVFWMVGYAGMWFEKWILADIFADAGESIIVDGIKTFLYRSGASEPHISSTEILKHTFSAFMIPPFLLLILFLLIAYIIIVAKSHKKNSLNMNVTLSMLLIAILPIIWYMLSRQHSYAHGHFVFRLLAGSVATLSYLLLDWAGINKYNYK